MVLRSDILERVVKDTKDLTFQREKFEDYFVKLNCSKHQLKELIQRRIGLLFKQAAGRHEVTAKSIREERNFSRTRRQALEYE